VRANHPTPFPELNLVLRELVGQVKAALGNTFVVAYLQGSFAVGDFDEHSDVDFIVAVSDELSEREVAGLQALHPRVYGLEAPWAQHLEGSYFPLSTLREYRRSATPLWYLDQPDAYRNRFYQGLIVLSYCRMVHDLIAGAPGSKRTGAEWAKATLDAAWSPLIDRSWGARPDPAVSVRTPPDPADFDSTLHFVRFIIAASQRY